MLVRMCIWRGKKSGEGCWISVPKSLTHCSSRNQGSCFRLPTSSVTSLGGVSQYNRMKVEMEGLDLSLSLKKS